jgi:hypothetical protein
MLARKLYACRKVGAPTQAGISSFALKRRAGTSPAAGKSED